MKMHSLLAAAAVTGLAGSSMAAVIGTDNASQAAYDGADPKWVDGDDGAATGDAFAPWGLTANGNGGFAGFFIGDSTGLAGGSGANINSNPGNESFGMYANSNGAATADAYRAFNGGLNVGQTFSIDIAVNFRNGNKGVDVLNGLGLPLFNLNIGGDDHVVSNVATGGGSLGDAYSSNTAFNIALTQTSLLGGTWTVTRSGGATDSDTGTYLGVASAFNAYIGGTEGGDSNNLFVNNPSIVPEPTSLALMGLAGLFLRRKR